MHSHTSSLRLMSRLVVVLLLFSAITYSESFGIHTAYAAVSPCSDPSIDTRSPVGAGNYVSTSNYIYYNRGTWTSYSNVPNTISGTIKGTTSTNGSAILRFNGSNIAYFYSMGTDRGPFTVCIDGLPRTSQTAYAADRRRQIGWTWDMSYGIHTIEVVKNSGAGSIDVDAFIVDLIRYSADQVYDDTNPDGTRSSIFRFVDNTTWNTYNNVMGANNGSFTKSNVATNLVRINLTTGATFDYGYGKCPSRGRVSITVDGVDRGYVDQYDPGIVRNNVKTYATLGSGSHVINMTITGQKGNSAATDVEGDIDYMI